MSPRRLMFGGGRVTVTPSVDPGGGDNPITVDSIVDLLTALADDQYDEIIVEDGTYACSHAPVQASNSLYIGSDFAGRTLPVVVRAETDGGVIFDGGDDSLGMYILDGARNITWQGFNFANWTPDQTGVIVIGGDPSLPPPHDITLKGITLESTCRRVDDPDNNAQGFYLAHALTRGPYNILLEDCTVIGTHALCLWSGLHGFHGDGSSPPADTVTVRNLTIEGTLQAIVMWFNTGIQHDWLIDGATVTNAEQFAVRFESIDAEDIELHDVISTGSGTQGFYSDLGPTPPGLSFTGTTDLD